MNCHDTRRLLDADLDGELDLVTHLEVREHLRSCPECTERAEAAEARRTALKTALPRFTAPAALAKRVQASVQAGQARSDSVAMREKRATAPVLVFWQVTGLAASIAIALVAGYSWGSYRVGQQALLGELVGDHVRSLQADHLTDVASTNQHTVKPWFAGKTTFSPPVVDLASEGFPLVGGRLETIDGHTAAALVFHRRQHAINVFIWPKVAAPMSPHVTERDGFNVVTWTAGDLAFAAVSEIPLSELESFVAEYRRTTP